MRLILLVIPTVALQPPPLSLCGAPNKMWRWKDQDIRYYKNEGTKNGLSVVLVHGLFVNADHWRKTFPTLVEEGYSVYAVDMLGSGYSSKPDPSDDNVVSGEQEIEDVVMVESLGTSCGKLRPGKIGVPQRHPLGSPYNFYTWSEQLIDFIEEIVPTDRVALVCNSIGCITGLLAATKRPDLIAGLTCIAPNFRELHVTENPKIAQPATRGIQALLRETAVGEWLFEQLANPTAVKQILKEPYHDPANVDDALVDALLTPLKLPGARAVVFDALSYSAGPLPEQLLQHPNLTTVPVWISLGLQDPWTPKPRITALDRFDPVKRVDLIPDCGHCPHDERPEVVNPLILNFLHSI